VKTIPLTKGEVAIVDDADYEELMQWSWTCLVTKGRKYARRGERDRRAGTQTCIYMHRQIMNAPEGVEVDHRVGDGLDNRRANLRLCTHSQNLCNAKVNAGNKSGFRGVSFDAAKRKWYASIRVNGKTKAIGKFNTALEAASAWNMAALETHGEFARLNQL